MHGTAGANYLTRTSSFRIEQPTSIIQHVSSPHFFLTVTLAADGDGTAVDWSHEFDDAAVAERVGHIT